jgi:hypothetical protein
MKAYTSPESKRIIIMDFVVRHSQPGFNSKMYNKEHHVVPKHILASELP